MSTPVPGQRFVPFARQLSDHGNRPALLTADEVVTYADLAGRVAEFSEVLGRQRRLLLLGAANTVGTVVAYLAALSSGSPVLLTAAGGVDAMTSAYDPDVVIDGSGDRPLVEERRAVGRHELHRDLALLLSTSGSTGSAKLVRLSHDNLRSNAASIAEYLALRDDDRAATTLSLHYCYGLSVLNSHLSRGAAVVLTGLSVSDEGFWELFRTRRATSFAGVPYTFELLDRVGFDAMALPDLRYVTQAGGRLAPADVRRYAELGRRAGWELFVMYGQTEATARMAYLPPALAPQHPECVGVPVPGGRFRLDPVPDWPGDDTGELVYHGANVMLGYAHGPADLARGRTQEELRTGDIARLGPHGLYQIVGRRSRFLKLFGLRVDPHGIEELLADHGTGAICVGDDEELVVAIAGAGGAATIDADRVRQLIAREVGLPARVIRVLPVAELPRLGNGKPDYPAVERLAAESRPATWEDQPARESVDLKALYSRALGVSDVGDDDSFVSLGGDSLSYVTTSVRLERALGHLPTAWHTLSIGELRQVSRAPRSRVRWLETSTALRAVSIVLVVGTHITLFWLAGGAHILLGVAGYNFARFPLTAGNRGERVRRALWSTGRIVGVVGIWLAIVACGYRAWPSTFASGGEYWFVEALVPITLGATALMSLPVVDRWERRWPFAVPLALALAGLLVRYDLVPAPPSPFAIPRLVEPEGFDRWANPAVIFWLFAVGWAAARATRHWQRAVLTAIVVLAVPGFFTHPREDVLVAAGVLLLVWVPAVPSVGLLNRLAGVVAASSLCVYLTHWQIYPRIGDALAGVPGGPLVVTAGTIAVGALYQLATDRASVLLAAAREAFQRRGATAPPTLSDV
ncbi:AMP-dependent synthetase [Longispora fulva]|uniref:Acyl-CoA synthetase (AMP-forming)/AMP-acid ligase II n=1 Tax=Longispora fulva TaxID=619741 RepID=A0A8J7KGT8_9ACTN|nr:non-ribosomal peptide synthetase [Longispora fulva]MBG6137745.1 acyl-CoA synthetase (AMP-forming)/AMP-acid ligase II [Longispora fulva]GIG62099.1 AMP-dependent synthetase [Longispora fulva]